MCGLTIRGAVGEGHLVQLSTRSPETLNICDVTCSFEDDIFEGSGGICIDMANALRQEIGNAEVYDSADTEKELETVKEVGDTSSGCTLPGFAASSSVAFYLYFCMRMLYFM